ncbi:hypothetical protein M3J09_010960 [Ascochyta lentis]
MPLPLMAIRVIHSTIDGWTSSDFAEQRGATDATTQIYLPFDLTIHGDSISSISSTLYS